MHPPQPVRVAKNVDVEVEAERFGNKGEVVRVTSADLIFVAINEKREKVAIGK